MHTTHFELIMLALSDRAQYLIQYFEGIKEFDIEDKHPVIESIFDTIFKPELCSKLFGTPNLDRSIRIQRKMDLSVLKEIYHLWRDQNYFDISSELVEELRNTDLKDINTFFLRAPFRSMYISLPKENGYFINNPQSGRHEITSIYLTMDDYDKPKDISILKKDINIMGVTKQIHMLVCGETKGVFGDAIMHFELIFVDGKVSESIEKNKEILDNPDIWDDIVEVFYFITKVLLYINCSNISIQKIAGLNLEKKLEGLKNNAKKRKLIQKYSKISPVAHNFLDIVINQNNGVQGKSGNFSKKLGPKKLEKVRRHFKVQHYGTGLSQSKIIWVESYVRGEGSEFYKDKNIYRVV